jgi:hypothetical protein
MSNNFEDKTILTLKIGNRTCSIELEGSDHTASELIESFTSLMVGQTFLDKSCYKAMREISDDHLNEAE